MLALALSISAHASHAKNLENTPPPPPDLLLPDGRKLTFERIFESDRDVVTKRGFWTKVLDAVIGDPERHRMIRPYSIAVDSRGRAIVTDPGAMGVHIFDFAQHKYKFVTRRDKGENSLRSPQCVAVDASDNFYVTDSESGRIFVFRLEWQVQTLIGNLRGWGRLLQASNWNRRGLGGAAYLCDRYPAQQGFRYGYAGQCDRDDRKNWNQPGEFNFPTEVVLHGQRHRRSGRDELPRAGF